MPNGLNTSRWTRSSKSWFVSRSSTYAARVNPSLLYAMRVPGGQRDCRAAGFTASSSAIERPTGSGSRSSLKRTKSKPAVCSRRLDTRTGLVFSHGFEKEASGTRSRTRSSSVRRPCSTSRITVSAVMFLVTEPRRKTVSAVTGRRASTSASPTPPVQITPSRLATLMPAPGTPACSRIAAIRCVSPETSCAATCCCIAPLGELMRLEARTTARLMTVTNRNLMPRQSYAPSSAVRTRCGSRHRLS
jgi:hypothetical protein